MAINPDSDLREVAKNRGWEIRDFRTGRKAAKIGVPTALVLGAAGGASPRHTPPAHASATTAA